MPFDLKRYPDNWIEISYEIRFVRAGGRCECTGECGTHEGKCDAVHGQPHPRSGSNVLLTTAHLGIEKPDGTPGDKHDKMDCRPENLKAMCQRCHLIFDQPEHKFNAANTRRAKKIAAGQMELL